jgi:secondary thiamine-phosphate synthase enzyme
MISHEHFTVQTHGQGLLEITNDLSTILNKSNLDQGLMHIFCQHTSCSLMLMENADPTAKRDLEAFFERLIPENDPQYTHTLEGPDDMPSHIKMALTRSSETIPFENRRLLLGTWQGLFLWEHRTAAHSRKLIVSLQTH